MYENETFPLHLQGCYDKAIEYIKQHSLYITLACAIVPILLVSRALTVPGITKSKDGRAYLRAVFSVNNSLCIKNHLKFQGISGPSSLTSSEPRFISPLYCVQRKQCDGEKASGCRRC